MNNYFDIDNPLICQIGFILNKICDLFLADFAETAEKVITNSASICAICRRFSIPGKIPDIHIPIGIDQ